MKNLGILFRYEMKKIWRRKLTWVVVILLAGIFSYSTINSQRSGISGTFTITNENGEEISQYLSVNDQFKIKIEGSQLLSGQLIDESFFNTAKETIPLSAESQDQKSYFLLIDPSYYDFYSFYGDFLDGTAEDYYTQRDEAIKYNLQRAGLSSDEMDYWENIAEQVETPFVYQQISGGQALLDVLGSGGIAIIIPLLAGILLCELFSQERRTKVDKLIFSTQRGRFPLYLAKVLAGEISVLLAVAIISGVSIATNLLVYGYSSLSGAIQLLPWLWSSILPITIGQAVLMLLMLLLTYGLLCGAITAMVSALSGSGVVSLAISIGIMLLTMRQYDVSWVEYLPANLVDQHTFMSLTLTNIFGINLNFFQSGLLLYMALAFLLFILCWLCWRWKAIKGN